jgi:hypothetical protein
MKMEYHRVLPSGVPKENRYLPKNSYKICSVNYRSSLRVRRNYVKYGLVLSRVRRCLKGYKRPVMGKTIQTLINAEKSDLFDVLEYISFAVQPITREARVANAQPYIFLFLNNKQKEFLEFVL